MPWVSLPGLRFIVVINKSVKTKCFPLELEASTCNIRRWRQETSAWVWWPGMGQWWGHIGPIRGQHRPHIDQSEAGLGDPGGWGDGQYNESNSVIKQGITRQIYLASLALHPTSQFPSCWNKDFNRFQVNSHLSLTTSLLRSSAIMDSQWNGLIRSRIHRQMNFL